MSQNSVLLCFSAGFNKSLNLPPPPVHSSLSSIAVSTSVSQLDFPRKRESFEVSAIRLRLEARVKLGSSSLLRGSELVSADLSSTAPQIADVTVSRVAVLG